MNTTLVAAVTALAIAAGPQSSTGCLGSCLPPPFPVAVVPEPTELDAPEGSRNNGQGKGKGAKNKAVRGPAPSRYDGGSGNR